MDYPQLLQNCLEAIMGATPPPLEHFTILCQTIQVAVQAGKPPVPPPVVPKQTETTTHSVPPTLPPGKTLSIQKVSHEVGKAEEHPKLGLNLYRAKFWLYTTEAAINGVEINPKLTQRLERDLEALQRELELDLHLTMFRNNPEVQALAETYPNAYPRLQELLEKESDESIALKGWNEACKHLDPQGVTETLLKDYDLDSVRLQAYVAETETFLKAYESAKFLDMVHLAEPSLAPKLNAISLRMLLLLVENYFEDDRVVKLLDKLYNTELENRLSIARDAYEPETIEEITVDDYE